MMHFLAKLITMKKGCTCHTVDAPIESYKIAIFKAFCITFARKLIIFLVVITAVELRLDAADRRISDRYKMIDYREEDHEKEIVHFSSDYFTTISVPTMVGTKYFSLI